MPDNSKYLIQIDGGDGLFFLSEHGEYTAEIQKARIFMSDLMRIPMSISMDCTNWLVFVEY